MRSLERQLLSLLAVQLVAPMAMTLVAAAPTPPVITAPDSVLAGTKYLGASTSWQSGCSFSWTITGGLFTNGTARATGSWVGFNAGAAGQLTLTCTATNKTTGASAVGRKVITVQPGGVKAPVITASDRVLSGATGLGATVPWQDQCDLAWTIVGGTFIDGTTQATGTQVNYRTGSAPQLTLSCTATHRVTKETATGTKTVTVVPKAQAPVITADTSVAKGSTGLKASVPAQVGWTFSWAITGGTLTSQATGTEVTYTAGTGNSVVLTCTVKDIAGNTASGTVSIPTVTALPAPVITTVPSATASTSPFRASVTPQAGLTYAWTIMGGSFSGGGTTATGSSVSCVAPIAGQVTLSCRATNAAGTISPEGTATVTIHPAMQTPLITAVPATATKGATGLTASVPAQAGCTFSWTITGGTLISAATGTQITYTAGTGDSVGLSCVATDGAGRTLTGTKSVPTVVAPTAPAITTVPSATASTSPFQASVTPQAGLTYAWTIMGGSFSGGGTTATGSSVSCVAPIAGQVTLSCRATNAAGTISPEGTATVTIHPAMQTPVITAVPATATKGATGLTANVPAQAGCTFSWTITGGTLSSAATGTQITYTAGTGDSVGLSCVATDGAGRTLTGTKNVPTVVAPTAPAIGTVSSATASTSPLQANVTAQAGFTYAWTITGGSFSGGGTTATGTSVSYVAAAAGQVTLTCRATNAAGTTSPEGTETVTIHPAMLTPVITPLPATVTKGATGLTASVPDQAGCTFSWSITGGNFSSAATGTQITYTAGTADTVLLTCVVTDGAGRTLTGTKNVPTVAAPAAPVISTVPSATASTSPFQALVTPQAGLTYAWTIMGGSFSGGGTTATGSSVSCVAPIAGQVSLSCVATNEAGTSSPAGAAAVTIHPAMQTPVITAAAAVTKGATGLTASVPDQAGCTFIWSLTGGTLSSSASGTQITYTAGMADSVGLTCVVRDGARRNLWGTRTVTAVAAPLAPTIDSASSVPAGQTGVSASVAAQTGCTYSWSITGGTFDGGAAHPAQPQVTYTAGSAGTLVLECTVTNAANTGVTGRKEVQVTSVSRPVTPSIQTRDVLAVRTGQAASVAAQDGCTFRWNIAGGTFAGGTTTASGTQVTYGAVNVGTIRLECTATNAAGVSSEPGQCSVDVLGPVQYPEIQAADMVSVSTKSLKASVAPQTRCTFSWVITGGTFAGGGTSATGLEVSYIASNAGALTLTCTATDALGRSAQGTKRITVLPSATAPVINGRSVVSASSDAVGAYVSNQAGCSFTWTIQGSVFSDERTSATGTDVGYLATKAGDITLSCTATDLAGNSATSSKTVQVVEPPRAPAIHAPSRVMMSNNFDLWAKVENPRSDCTYGWTITGGLFDNATQKVEGVRVVFNASQAATKVSLTCSATNRAGDSKASTVWMDSFHEAPLLAFKGDTYVLPDGGVKFLRVESLQGQGPRRYYVEGGTRVSLTQEEGWDVIGYTVGTGNPVRLTVLTGNVSGDYTESSKNVYVCTPGTFVPGPRMNLERSGSKFTLLPNGDVYVTGGGLTSGLQDEMYSAERGEWVLQGTYNTLADHTATLLADGRILLAGGCPTRLARTDSGSDTISRLAILTPGLGFNIAGDLPNPLQNHEACLLPDGLVMMSGGTSYTWHDGSNWQQRFNLSVATFNPVDGSIRSPLDGLLPRYGHRVLSRNGINILVGGIDSPGRPAADSHGPTKCQWFLDDCKVLNEGFTLPHSLAEFAAAPLLNQPGFFLLAGGTDNVSNSISNAYLVRASNGDVTPTVTPTGSMRLQRWDCDASPLFDGRVLVAGGDNHGDGLISAEIYDINTQSFRWTTGPDGSQTTMSRPRRGRFMTLLPNGLVLLAGGEPIGSSDSTPSLETEFYVPEGWTPAANVAPPAAIFVERENDTTIEVRSETYDPDCSYWWTVNGVPTAPESRNGNRATLHLPEGRISTITLLVIRRGMPNTCSIQRVR